MIPQKYTLSTSILYPNAKPHMGHALELVQADFLARYHRLHGSDVYFQTGVDEHGLKISKAATAADQSERAFVDGQAEHFKALVSALNVQPDRFIRTTESEHVQLAQAFWRRCMANGDIYKKTYRAWYDVKEEAFLGSIDDNPDPSVFGVEERFLERIEEENYFFKQSKYQDQILALLKNKEIAIVPDHRSVEMIHFIEKEGLQDISISRSKERLSWGIPVPDDDSQVMYVWFDALTNYLTGTARVDENGDIQPDERWPYDLHIVGKDIARFHAILWPAMLLSAGLDLPKRILVHGFLLSDGKKMSKSIGNVVDPIDALAIAGVDALRWYLLAEIPTVGDGDFTTDRLRMVYSSALANDYGNLVSRVVAMAKKYGEGKLPSVDMDKVKNLEEAILHETWVHYRNDVRELHLNDALEHAHHLVVFCNRRIEELKPWELAKDPGKAEELAECLYELTELIRHATLMMLPAIPESAEKVLNTVFAAMPESDRMSTEWGTTPNEMPLPQDALILFPRLEDAD